MNNVVPLRPLDDRPLPENIDLEQAVLGSLIMHNAIWSDLRAVVKAEHFSSELHRRIFEVAGKLIEGGSLASPVTLKTFLGDHDVAGLTISQYLARMAAAALPMAAPGFARAVADLSARREIIAVTSELSDRAHDAPPDMRPAILAAQAVSVLQEIARSGADDVARVEAWSGAGAMLDQLDADREAGVVREFNSTGFTDIDRKTGGYEPGLLWIIGARPSQGKTAHMFASATRAARRAAQGKDGGCGALCFSLEDDEKQAMARILAHMAYTGRNPIHYGSIYRGHIDAEQSQRLRDMKQKLEDMPLVMDFSSSPTVDQIAYRVRTEKVRMAKKGHRLGVVFIDYLDFIKAPDRYAGNRNHEKGETAKSLKVLARDEQVCVVLYSQLNRATEKEADKRPTLANLRDSGELEQDANVAAFLHREAYYIERSPEYRRGDPETMARLMDVQNVCEFIIAKNKAGPIGTVNLFCDVAASHMSEIQRSFP